MIRGMKCAGKRMAYVLAAALFLTSCGKEEPLKDGLVPMETAKGYEHIAKLETEPVQSGDNVQPPNTGNVNTPTDTVTPAVTQPPDTGTPAPMEDIVYVAVSKLNLRTAPSLESEVVAQAKYGDSFVRIEKGTEWDKLLYNDQEVYAFAEFLTEKKVAGMQDSLAGTVMADAKKK